MNLSYFTVFSGIPDGPGRDSIVIRRSGKRSFAPAEKMAAFPVRSRIALSISLPLYSMRTLAFAGGIFLHPDEKAQAANAGKCTRDCGARGRVDFRSSEARGRRVRSASTDQRDLPFSEILRSGVSLLPGRNIHSPLINTILPPRPGFTPFPCPRLVLYDYLY